MYRNTQRIAECIKWLEEKRLLGALYVDQTEVVTVIGENNEIGRSIGELNGRNRINGWQSFGEDAPWKVADGSSPSLAYVNYGSVNPWGEILVRIQVNHKYGAIVTTG